MVVFLAYGDGKNQNFLAVNDIFVLKGNFHIVNCWGKIPSSLHFFSSKIFCSAHISKKRISKVIYSSDTEILLAKR